MAYWHNLQSAPPAFTLAPDGYAQGALWWALIIVLGLPIGALAGWGICA